MAILRGDRRLEPNYYSIATGAPRLASRFAVLDFAAGQVARIFAVTSRAESAVSPPRRARARHLLR
jgi:hypothetical protein